MLTADEIEDLYEKKAHHERWVFTPVWKNPLKGFRYALTFIPAERRFALSRQKIEPFKAVDDDELLQAFRSQLSEEEIASCMRDALNPPPDDDIPF